MALVQSQSLRPFGLHLFLFTKVQPVMDCIGTVENESETTV